MTFNDRAGPWRLVLGLLLAFGGTMAFWVGYQPIRQTPCARSVVVRFDADDKSARVVIDGKDFGVVPVPVYLNPEATYALTVGGHHDPAYRPERGRCYVARDGTKIIEPVSR